AIYSLPYALQLAYGWTSLALTANTVAVVLLVPLAIWAAITYGTTGTALVWMLLNLGYVLISEQVMHARLLPSEKWQWYRSDVAVPLLAACLVAVPSRLFVTTLHGRWHLFVGLAAISIM